MHGLDFLFLATVVVGLYAIHRILGVSAWVTARRREVLGALFVEMRDQMPQPLRAITTVPTVRDLVYFPFSLLGGLLPERRRGAGRCPAARRNGRGPSLQGAPRLRPALKHP